MMIRYRPFFFLLAIALFAGCNLAGNPTPQGRLVPRTATIELPTAAPVGEPSPANTRVLPFETFTPVPTNPITPTITPIPDEAQGLVIEVIDGQTIAVVMKGDPVQQAYLVRYIGIEAPAPDDPWGAVARETNRRMTNLKVVRLVRDETDFDEEGYLLRYVYIHDQLMSIILAEQGLARAEITEPNTRLAEEIRAAEQRAREGNLGLWGERQPTTTPTAARPELPTPTPTVLILVVTATPEPEETP